MTEQTCFTKMKTKTVTTSTGTRAWPRETFGKQGSHSDRMTTVLLDFKLNLMSPPPGVIA